MQYLQFCMFAYLFCACSAYTAKEIYASLPDEDKGHFVRYNLAKGFVQSKFNNQTRNAAVYLGMDFPNDLHIPQEKLEAFQQFDIEPKTFPLQLLDNYSNKLNLTHFELFYGVMASCGVCECISCAEFFCIPQTRHCVNTGDNGMICCT